MAPFELFKSLKIPLRFDYEDAIKPHALDPYHRQLRADWDNANKELKGKSLDLFSEPRKYNMRIKMPKMEFDKYEKTFHYSPISKHHVVDPIEYTKPPQDPGHDIEPLSIEEEKDMIEQTFNLPGDRLQTKFRNTAAYELLGSRPNWTNSDLLRHNAQYASGARKQTVFESGTVDPARVRAALFTKLGRSASALPPPPPSSSLSPIPASAKSSSSSAPTPALATSGASSSSSAPTPASATSGASSSSSAPTPASATSGTSSVIGSPLAGIQKNRLASFEEYMKAIDEYNKTNVKTIDDDEVVSLVSKKSIDKFKEGLLKSKERATQRIATGTQLPASVPKKKFGFGMPKKTKSTIEVAPVVTAPTFPLSTPVSVQVPERNKFIAAKAAATAPPPPAPAPAEATATETATAPTVKTAPAEKPTVPTEYLDYLGNAITESQATDQIVKALSPGGAYYGNQKKIDIKDILNYAKLKGIDIDELKNKSLPEQKKKMRSGLGLITKSKKK